MPHNRSWDNHSITYRSKEMATVARWIVAEQSCSVVGPPGCGRSNFLGFLSHRADALQQHLPDDFGEVAVIPIDIFSLPTYDLSTLCRTILHEFYWVNERFEPELQQAVTKLYMDNRSEQDPFLSHKALLEMLSLFQEHEIRVVMVLNRFDRFCEEATPRMINTLRWLRDYFRHSVTYVVGMQQEAKYLPDPTVLGDMQPIIDSQVCWVGSMHDVDAAKVLADKVGPSQVKLTDKEIDTILALAGNFPSLITEIVAWRLSIAFRPLPPEQWLDPVLKADNVQDRLRRVWNSLTQEEKQALSEIQKLQAQARKDAAAFRKLEEQQYTALSRLYAKGLCRQTGASWEVVGDLLTAFIATMEGRVRGKIWVDEETKYVYQGQRLIEGLTALQYEIVRFLVKNPRSKHTSDEIIDNAWPDEDQREGITPNALQVHIRSIRKLIELNPSNPRYLLTWHGRPGGYQFFPEGKPE